MSTLHIPTPSEGCGRDQWKHPPEGNTGDVRSGKSQGRGLGSHESGGVRVFGFIHMVFVLSQGWA